jgi:hypothetical protein
LDSFSLPHDNYDRDRKPDEVSFSHGLLSLFSENNTAIYAIADESNELRYCRFFNYINFGDDQKAIESPQQEQKIISARSSPDDNELKLKIES